jgi:hypothetical protein
MTLLARLRNLITEPARCRHPDICPRRAGRNHLLCPDHRAAETAHANSLRCAR